jgi:hypothetical protein
MIEIALVRLRRSKNPQYFYFYLDETAIGTGDRYQNTLPQWGNCFGGNGRINSKHSLNLCAIPNTFLLARLLFLSFLSLLYFNAVCCEQQAIRGIKRGTWLNPDREAQQQFLLMAACWSLAAPEAVF